MSNQVEDCFKCLWPFQNVRTLTPIKNLDLIKIFFKVQPLNAVKQAIENSNKDDWTWLRNQPKATLWFCRDSGVFIAILLKAFQECGHTLDELITAEYFNGNTILHCLSKDPLSKDQINFVMGILCHKDIVPGKNNKVPKS